MIICIGNFIHIMCSGYLLSNLELYVCCYFFQEEPAEESDEDMGLGLFD